MRSNVLAIVVPVYNEGASIGGTLTDIRTKVQVPFAVFIVFDFDEDTTLPAVRLWQQHPDNQEVSISLLKNKWGNGALNAIKTGLFASNQEAVLVTMADSSDDMATVNEMMKLFNLGADIVCGSRYMRGGRQIGGAWCKTTLSRLAGLSLFWFTGLPTHDATNSFKVYRRRVLEDIPIESRGGFELGLELVVKAYLKGFSIREVPTTWRDRVDGMSRFQLWAWLPHYLKWYFMAWRGFWVVRFSKLIHGGRV